MLNEEELYDVNTISSMFKAWLRDLPDEVFPKALQHKIAASVPKISEQQGAPELLKQELSQLAPFNYYLLFAVTAHITMLLNSSKENKMTFHNLCVCFMPALKMEMPCFQWLILDWKNCWQGCSTEREYLEREYAILDKRDPEQEGTDSRVMPLQHFDRYPPPSQRQQDSRKGTSDRSDPRRAESNERGRALRNASASHSTSQSPAPRPATSPVGSNDNETLASNDSAARRERNHRPAPLESSSLSGSRRGSEPASQPDFGPRKDKENKRSGRDEVAELQKRLEDLPELSPVKPLSPFGSLDSA